MSKGPGVPSMSLASSEVTAATQTDASTSTGVAAKYGLSPPPAGIAARSARGSGSRKASPRSGPVRRVRSRGSSPPERPTLSTGAVLIGTLTGFNDAGAPLVVHPLDTSDRPVPARTTVPLAGLIDKEVVVA